MLCLCVCRVFLISVCVLLRAVRVNTCPVSFHLLGAYVLQNPLSTPHPVPMEYFLLFLLDLARIRYIPDLSQRIQHCVFRLAERTFPVVGGRRHLPTPPQPQQAGVLANHTILATSAPSSSASGSSSSSEETTSTTNTTTPIAIIMEHNCSSSSSSTLSSSSAEKKSNSSSGGDVGNGDNRNTGAAGGAVAAGGSPASDLTSKLM